jgi:hypothetical protein
MYFHPAWVMRPLTRQAKLAVSDPTLGGCLMVRWVPGLRTVSSYRRIWLARDIIAGVVLTTLLVPQGMAYAELGRCSPAPWASP